MRLSNPCVGSIMMFRCVTYIWPMSPYHVAQDVWSAKHRVPSRMKFLGRADGLLEAGQCRNYWIFEVWLSTTIPGVGEVHVSTCRDRLHSRLDWSTDNWCLLGLRVLCKGCREYHPVTGSKLEWPLRNRSGGYLGVECGKVQRIENSKTLHSTVLFAFEEAQAYSTLLQGNHQGQSVNKDLSFC